MRRHLVRAALAVAVLFPLTAVPRVPAGAAADASGYCIYVLRGGAGLTICV